MEVQNTVCQAFPGGRDGPSITKLCKWSYTDGFVQDWDNSTANALELPQSYTQALISSYQPGDLFWKNAYSNATTLGLHRAPFYEPPEGDVTVWSCGDIHWDKWGNGTAFAFDGLHVCVALGCRGAWNTSCSVHIASCGGPKREKKGRLEAMLSHCKHFCSLKGEGKLGL